MAGQFKRGEYEVVFVRAPEDPPLFSDEYQKELRQYTQLLHGPGVSHRAFTMDAVGAQGGALGELAFTTLVQWGPTIITAAAAYLVGRLNRKIRFKHGDLEIETNSVKELQRIMDLAAEREKAKAKAEPLAGGDEKDKG